MRILIILISIFVVQLSCGKDESKTKSGESCNESQAGTWSKGTNSNGKEGATYCSYGKWGDGLTCKEGFGPAFTADKKIAWCADKEGLPSAEVASGTSNCPKKDTYSIGYDSSGRKGAINCGVSWDAFGGSLICKEGFFPKISADMTVAWCADKDGLPSAQVVKGMSHCLEENDGTWSIGYGANGQKGAIKCNSRYWAGITGGSDLFCKEDFSYKFSDDKKTAWCVDKDGLPSAQVGSGSGSLSGCLPMEEGTYTIGYNDMGQKAAIKCFVGTRVNGLNCSDISKIKLSSDRRNATCQ